MNGIKQTATRWRVFLNSKSPYWMESLRHAHDGEFFSIQIIPIEWNKQTCTRWGIFLGSNNSYWIEWNGQVNDGEFFSVQIILIEWNQTDIHTLGSFSQFKESLLNGITHIDTWWGIFLNSNNPYWVEQTDRHTMGNFSQIK